MFKKILKFGLVSILTFTWVVAFVPSITNTAFATENCSEIANDPNAILRHIGNKTKFPDGIEKPAALDKCTAEIKSVVCPENEVEQCELTKKNSLIAVENEKASAVLRLSLDDALIATFSGFDTSQMKNPNNMCPPEREMTNRVAVYIEEALEDISHSSDVDLDPNDPRNNVWNCFRNTFCIDRGKGLECHAYNNIKEYCSEVASQISYDQETGAAKVNGQRISVSCEPIQVIIGKDGINILYTYIGMIYRYGASMVGIIAVIVLVISGIQISSAAGDSKAITDAKTRIFHSILGIAILFLSAIILYTINPTFFVK